MRSQRASNSGEPGMAGSTCKVWKNTLSSFFPLNTAHSSSAVNERIGAIRRTRLEVMCQSAVCAERRACEAGAAVYRRSLRISR